MDYERQLKRLRKRVKLLEDNYIGREDEFTFHAGFELGYFIGMVRVLEEIEDDVKEVFSDEE